MNLISNFYWTLQFLELKRMCALPNMGRAKHRLQPFTFQMIGISTPAYWGVLSCLGDIRVIICLTCTLKACANSSCTKRFHLSPQMGLVVQSFRWSWYTNMKSILLDVFDDLTIQEQKNTDDTSRLPIDVDKVLLVLELEDNDSLQCAKDNANRVSNDQPIVSSGLRFDSSTTHTTNNQPNMSIQVDRRPQTDIQKLTTPVRWIDYDFAIKTDDECNVCPISDQLKDILHRSTEIPLSGFVTMLPQNKFRPMCNQMICTPHRFHLSVRVLFDDQQIKEILENIRKTVQYFRK